MAGPIVSLNGSRSASGGAFAPSIWNEYPVAPCGVREARIATAPILPAKAYPLAFDPLNEPAGIANT